jgi:hypothetical protein
MFHRKSQKLRTALILAVLALLVLVPATVALAAANPAGTGQPSVECDEFSSLPGNSDTGPGSAFNEDGVAGTVYAGEQPQNSVNEHSVSQYDVACFQVSQH